MTSTISAGSGGVTVTTEGGGSASAIAAKIAAQTAQGAAETAQAAAVAAKDDAETAAALAAPLLDYTSEITAVAAVTGEVVVVAGIADDVVAVANNAADVSTVSGDIANVNLVAPAVAEIVAISGDLANIDAVAAIADDVATVAAAIDLDVSGAEALIAAAGEAVTGTGGTIDVATAAGIAALGAEGANQAASVAAAAATGIPYDTVADGLADTTSGQSFLVWGDGSATYAIGYRNDSGSADLVATYPDKAALDTLRDELINTVRYVGQPSPITGSPAGNTTYIIDNVSDDPWVVTEIPVFGLSSGGDVYIKALDDSTGAWTGRALATVSVPAGASVISVYLPLLPGERLAFWGQNIIPLVGNGGGLVAYYTLAGNVLTGAIGSLTTNTALQIGFKLMSTRRESDAGVVALDAQTSDDRIKFIGLADADLGSSLSSATAYYDPRPLPAGTPEVLYVYGRTAGWATLVLDYPTTETKHTRYFEMPIYIDLGKTAITRGDTTPGKGFPLDLVTKEGTIAAVVCPSGGAQIAYTSTDGPGTSGENVIGYRLPQGNFQGTAAGGERALTWSATSNRQMAWEWQITEHASPRKRDRQRQVFVDVQFTEAAKPIDLYAQGTAPTYNVGYAQSAATGFGNNLRQRFGHCFDKQHRRTVQTFGDSASKIVSDIRPVGGGYGSSVMLDVAANEITVYVGHNATSSTPTASSGFPATWPGTLDATDSIIVTDWRRDGRSWNVTVTDIGVQPVVSYTYAVDLTLADIPPASGGIGTESASLQLMGQLNGSLGSLAIAGSVKTSHVLDLGLRRAARGLIVGDSISNASRCDYADGWAQQVQAACAANGIEVAIMAVDGWDMPAGCNTTKQALQLMPDLEWCIVALGTNRSASAASDPRDKNMFEASAQALLYDLQGRGIDPYFMAPAPHTYSPGATTAAERLAWLQSSAFTVIRGDLALTLSDGVTIDTSLFYNSGTSDVHPIAAGHAKLFERVKIDAPELFY